MKVNGISAYEGECRKCCIVYKVIGKFVMISALETIEIQKNKEQKFQYVSQKVLQDKNVDFFAAHFTKHLHKNQDHNNVVRLYLSKYFLRWTLSVQ